MGFSGILVRLKIDFWKYTMLVLFEKVLVPSLDISSISSNKEITTSLNSEYILLLFDPS